MNKISKSDRNVLLNLIIIFTFLFPFSPLYYENIFTWIDCQRSDWDCISDNTFFSISIRHSDHSLWGIDNDQGKLFSFSADKGGGLSSIFSAKTQKIDLIPEAMEYFQICPSEQIWLTKNIRANDNPDEVFTTYDFNSGSWDMKALTNHSLPTGYTWWSCVTTRSGEVVVFSDNWIGKFDGQLWTPMPIETEGEIMMLREDNEGNLWALSREGDLYHQDQSNLSWAYFGRFEGPGDLSSIFSFTIGRTSLWFLDTKYFYRWDLAQRDQGPEVIYTFPQKWHILDTFEDANGMVWIVRINGIWMFNGEEIKMIELPQDAGSIYGTAFDNDLQKLYISTDKGIFSLQVASEPE